MQKLVSEYAQLSIFNCNYCGQPLPKGRADMRCHKECRQKLYRRKKQLERQVKTALDTIQQLARATTADFYREEGIELLKLLNREINNAYAYNNIRRVS